MELFPVPDVPEIREGDDLAALISERVDLRPGDVVCVASTVVSKAEGRFADLDDFPAGPRARELAARLSELTDDEKDPRFAQAVLEESVDLVMDEPFLLTETRFGHVGVNAGIDRSNVPDHDLLLLPKRPNKSAERICAGITADRVIVSDTCGRPFRHGQRGVALGWAGLSASRDWRGETDRDGRELGVTVESVVDELAAAANLVQGEGDDGTPVVVVRNFEWGDHGESEAHFRDIDGDFVRQALRDWSYEP
ncbi:coenzyme F420-0:L-glutamate ligase [Haloferax mediterranei ATCC 33500]|uniref:Coenzyme F420:L-glutamate ligase n=1 Tax=Haloferax mediterranei (strain ATCC 33500 / DSM 1411 / JCM 8866 / NBRC 14739 / NCIMB 2177 / R-4) TaxID=523841 RepID=I3R661_HALMT|nr:coenzyme F420-0:L-glutamate ligase [Haloferax mediterranei]AFK19721.2 F420-0--gamma-glutamyl ligase [Haloferax mediterranei ATCC 33500]AHZ23109.1 F420-0--gamma-glutamyl ligase [Haloferax mediterranei ATCC 33500]EMA00043.1 F420-0--gamma-glutamyl ligase [Haloferax mediterranei ATCC 33500]MDX5987534.1 coenzyme F420-0:L-glutamate ligase [Haloferax mediterranei ATCC 33500]QCQ74031.1 coenzyme F420-0:L-glutamate ligase [Haloferax mediterranei ATCC 33500]